ncbi:MAG: pyrroloquinoline quinone precursor peptide PqqA [Proteobacteria bacterium]|nr:pyrroloquinoline quinone precursor peptide PqqA [Pseudomonadota bacterium]
MPPPQQCIPRIRLPADRNHQSKNWRLIMTWTTPQACDLRFGFEITMYIAAK